MKKPLVSLICLISSSLFAQNSFAQKMLQAKDSLGNGISAISLTEQCKDNPPLSYAAGTVTSDTNVPITTSSIFQIGSITKSFVAIVILQLAQEKQFSIDDDSLLSKWFPEYPKWGKITLRQLMDMTSGIPGTETPLNDDIFRQFTFKQYTNYINPVQILDLIYKLPLHFQPGSKYEYSNTNYTLLGQFIKKVTSQDPEDVVTDRIIKKLDLKNSYFIKNKVLEIKSIDPSQIVHGTYYTYPNSSPYSFMTNGSDIIDYSLSYANTSGAIISTPIDINTYLHALYQSQLLLNADQFKQFTSLVSKQTGQPIASPTAEDPQGYGFGVVALYLNEAHPLLYVYNGQTDGFNFAYLYDPKSQFCLTIAINSNAQILTLDTIMTYFLSLDQNCK